MLFELTSHFRMQYFVILLIAGVIYCCKKKWILLSIAAVFFIANVAVILPWYVPDRDKGADSYSQPLRLLFSNVHTGNNNYSSLIELVGRETPDIIVLEEVDNGWVNALKEKKLSDEYKFCEFCPRRDNFGLAVLSRIPLKDVNVKSFCEVMVPSIVAVIQIPKSELLLIATHPVPPATPGYYSWRNEQFEHIARYVSNDPRPCVIVGDLNLTMWSYYHDKFLAETGLKNARQGFGIKPTWPTILPPLFIPLDHCLCSSSIKVINFRTNGWIGSDHLPFIVDLLPPVGDR